MSEAEKKENAESVADLPIESERAEEVQAGAEPATYLQYKLDRCFVKSSSTSGGGGS